MQSIMQTISKSKDTAPVPPVPRVQLNRAGLSRLAGLIPYGSVGSAELLDAAGNLCGRATRMADPCAGRYGDGMVWHVQVGGHLVSREWAGTPMGCGSAETPHLAALAAQADLLHRADALLAQAGRIGAMLG